MFIGQFEHNIDKKGRLFIPAKFKESLGERFIISKTLGSKSCLSIYTLAEWEKLNEKIEGMGILKARQVRLFMHPNSSDLTPDAQGRINIPAVLREHAELTENAIIIGTGHHVEIWNKENWERESAEISAESIINILEDL